MKGTVNESRFKWRGLPRRVGVGNTARMHTSTALAFGLLLSFACNNSDKEASETGASLAADKAASAETTKATPAGGKSFDEALSKTPCALMSVEMVAAVAKVSAEQIERKEIASMCLFSWEGGAAGLSFVRVYKDLERGRERFGNAHKSMSGDEVKSAMQSVGAQAKKNLSEDAAKGKKVPAAGAVDTVAGGFAKSMGGGITFEPIEGLGDVAFFETTRHATAMAGTEVVSYANKTDVMIGNMSFSVTFAHDAVNHQGTMQKDEGIALAKAVLAALP